jgi:hypothetical protein
MALNDFFSMNLPYGMMKGNDGGWTLFNRDYQPLSERQKGITEDNKDSFTYTHFKRLSEKVLLEIADKVERDKNEEIERVWLYSSTTNPMLTKKIEHWNSYFSKIERLSKLSIDHSKQ